MNSVPATFGAVGTLMWFGFSQAPLSPSEILVVSWKSAVVHTIAALVVPIIALRFLVGWREIRQNLLFIYLSILSCALPSLFLARINYEFPSLIGGAIGLCFSVLLAKYQVGQARTHATKEAEVAPPSQGRERMLAFTPYLLLIAVLIVTRVRFLPLCGWLNAESPAMALDLDSLALKHWVDESEYVPDAILRTIDARPEDSRLFALAGAREHLFFNPADTRAGIVTCGGLCLGMNDVIRPLFLELHHNNGVKEVLGFRWGYQGLDPEHGDEPLVL